MDSNDLGQTAYVPFLRDGHDGASSMAVACSPKRFWLRRFGKKQFSAALGLIVVTSTALSVIYAYWMWATSTETLKLPVGAFLWNKEFLDGSVLENDASYSGRPADISMWTSKDFDDEFANFMTTHERSYDDEAERMRRYGIFKKNLVYVHVHNEQNFTFSLRMNHLGDLSDDEFRSQYLNMPMKKKYQAGLFFAGRDLNVDTSLLEVDEKSLPTSVDWRQNGCVTEVKDQERCGSCWAFSTTGSVEGAICVRTGVLPDLSEQQLVDCAGKEGNMGCNGGMSDWGFQYVIDNGGLCKESDYPYIGHDLGYCAASECEIIGDIKTFKDVPRENELALRAALSKHGPVSVAIEGDQKMFQLYHKGVFNAPCGTELDHAVLIVGYGTDQTTGQDYFIMKNSWGTVWGEEGYMRMARTPDNARSSKHHAGECGVLMSPSYALA